MSRSSTKRIYYNQTDKRIGIPFTSGNNVLIIPPFGERTVTVEEAAKLDYVPWKWHNLVLVKSESEASERDKVSETLGCLITSVVLGIFFGLPVTVLGYWVSGNWVSGNWVIGYWVIWVVVISAILAVLMHGGNLKLVLASLSQSITLLLTLGIGVGLPAAVVYFFGGGIELFAPEQLQQRPLAFLARSLQLFFVAAASLLPALLYFLFDRQKLGVLREDFLRNTIRLDPTITTLEDARSLYGRLVDEVYGREESDRNKERYLQVTRWPILVATLVIVLGWILALAPVGTISADLQPEDLDRLFIPRPTVVSFGFLGAYFFALNLIFRRYVRADLKPKAYSHITVRILTVLVLVLALNQVPLWSDSPYVFLLAFFVGIIPETGTAAVHEFLRNRKFIKDAFPSLQERLPLSCLEGITLYDKARLLEEGVENVENLVYHDLIDLMIQTRIPLPRLIDWIDQGLLYLHAVDPLVDNQGDKGNSSAQETLRFLREYGIRTATDLIKSFNTLQKNVESDSPEIKKIKVIKCALEDGQWLSHLRNWNAMDRFQDEVYILDSSILDNMLDNTGSSTMAVIQPRPFSLYSPRNSPRMKNEPDPV